MSVVGIVALSLLAGLFIAMLIGISAWLLWVGLQFRKIVIETRDTLSAHREQWATSLVELGTILSQHRALTDASIQKINGEQIGEAVERFNQLVTNFVSVAKRSEQAAIAITTCTRQWLNEASDEDEEDDGTSATGPGIPGIPSSYRPPSSGIGIGTGIGPDGYAVAAPGEHFIGRSKVAISDAEALLQEQTDHTQT